MKNNILNNQFCRRLLFLAVILCLCSNICYCQSTGDKMFRQAVELARKNTAESINQAVAKFKSAKIAFDSNAKKVLCDVEIKKCMKRLSFMKRKPTLKKEPERNEDVTAKAIDFGAVLWVGDVKAGVPNGHGKMYFRQNMVIDPRDPDEHVAGEGDYIDGEYVMGFLEMGRLFYKDGRTEMIIIGR